MPLVPRFPRIPQSLGEWDKWLRDAKDTLNGEFTGTLTGVTTTVTGTVEYEISGNIVCVSFPQMQGTSDTTACTITGAPDVIHPKSARVVIGRSTDSGSEAVCVFQVETTGVFTLFADISGGAFTNTGTKGTAGVAVHYPLT